MDIALILNEYDLSSMIDGYEVTCEPVTSRIVTTMDHVEHIPLPRYRVIIRFTLFPMSDSDEMSTFGILSEGIFDTVYTAPYAGGASREQEFRLSTNLSAVFNIRSVSGIRYYNGGQIELRAVAPGFGDVPDQESTDTLEES